MVKRSRGDEGLPDGGCFLGVSATILVVIHFHSRGCHLRMDCLSNEGLVVETVSRAQQQQQEYFSPSSRILNLAYTL